MINFKELCGDRKYWQKRSDDSEEALKLKIKIIEEKKKEIDQFFMDKAKDTLLSRGIAEELKWPDGRDGLSSFSCCCGYYLIIVVGEKTGQHYLFYPEDFVEGFDDDLYECFVY